VISYHSGDAFQNSYSSARLSYYGITSFPTAKFDGVLQHIGGSTTQSLYTTYLPLYQQRIAIPSSFTIDMYGENTGTTYNVTLVLTKVAASSASNIKAHLALTESNIPYSWYGQTEVDFAERLMVPNENGTAVDFTNNTEITLNLQFTVDPTWVLSNLELVAFLQDNTTQECLQGTKVLLNNLQPMNATANYSVSSQTPFKATSVQFTDLSGGEITSWNWSFEGGIPATSTLENPQVIYNTLGDYDVQLIVSDGKTIDTLMNPNYITVITAPAQPGTPTGNTVLCEGGQGVELTLDGSETGVDYELYLDNTPTGNILAGTGSALNFGYVTEQGIYSCLAFTTTCEQTMIGNSYVFIQYQPGQAEISVQGTNDCGTGSFSSILQVDVNQAPTPVVSGDNVVCSGDQGVEYATPATSGNTYQWAVTGGTVASGAGTHLVTVDWGTFGTGYVHVTETTVDGCDVTSNDFVVTIEDYTGIGENQSSAMKIYPNPVKDELVVEITPKEIKASELTILNQVGQQVSNQKINDGETTIRLNAASLSAGVYSVRILTTDGTSVEKKFVKVQ
jgi:PKD repeat protein